MEFHFQFLTQKKKKKKKKRNMDIGKTICYIMKLKYYEYFIMI